MSKKEKKEIVRFEDIKDDPIALLKASYQAIVQTLTGIFSSKPRELILSLGYIFQRTHGTEFLLTFIEELKRYREKGKIPENYFDTEQCKECLQELLDYLDKALPDEITFTLLKKIFLVAATEKKSTRESLLPQHYMRIIRKLSPGAILILNAVFQVVREGYDPNERGARAWLIKIAEKSSLKWVELVENYEEELINNKLITNRQHSDRSGVYLGNYYRLTELGYNLCHYIENYEEE
jgi:hypothetical protein